MRIPATYNDYAADSFRTQNENGVAIRTLKGDAAPIEMVTEGIQIKELRLKKGNHKIDIPDASMISAFIVEGSMKIGNKILNGEDFFKVQETSFLNIEANEDSWLFIIESPITPSYRTYASMNLG